MPLAVLQAVRAMHGGRTVSAWLNGHRCEPAYLAWTYRQRRLASRDSRASADTRSPRHRSYSYYISCTRGWRLTYYLFSGTVVRMTAVARLFSRGPNTAACARLGAPTMGLKNAYDDVEHRACHRRRCCVTSASLRRFVRSVNVASRLPTLL